MLRVCSRLRSGVADAATIEAASAATAAGIKAAANVSPSLHATYAAVLQGDIATAVTAPASPQELRFVAQQTSERGFLVYSSSAEERTQCIQLSAAGGHFQREGVPKMEASNLLDNALWSPEAQQEWTRSHMSLRYCQAAPALRRLYVAQHVLKMPIDAISDVPDEAVSKEFGDSAFLDGRDAQVVGRACVSRLLCGKIGSVLQSFMSSTFMGKHSQQVWSLHLAAARNFDAHLMAIGPVGPLELGDAGVKRGDGETATHEGKPAASTKELCDWAAMREKAVVTQLKLNARVVAETARQFMSPEDAEHFLSAARSMYTGECTDADTLQEALKIFDRTRDLL